jgi:hypothetical protein
VPVNARWRGGRVGDYPTWVNAAATPESLLDDVARTLGRLETRVRLVARASPPDVLVETARFAAEFSRGRRLALGAARGAAVTLAETRRALEELASLAEPLGELGRLHAARAVELELEARMVEALGTPALTALSALRFPAPSGALAQRCERFVAEALAAPLVPPVALHRSDDHADPASLVARLALRARELGLPLCVEVRRDQVATAATGHGVVRVRPGVLLSADAAERVALHELVAHALPRARAAHAPWALAAVGTAGAGDDEEGRAIVVEARSRWFDAERRRALALRHVAALGVREGAAPRDTMTRLTELGVPLGPASELALRVHRGGGLGRELTYLPRYCTLRDAFALEPRLERWFERGRFDLATARRFEAGELPWPSRRPSSVAPGAQPNSTTTGA